MTAEKQDGSCVHQAETAHGAEETDQTHCQMPSQWSCQQLSKRPVSGSHRQFRALHLINHNRDISQVSPMTRGALASPAWLASINELGARVRDRGPPRRPLGPPSILHCPSPFCPGPPIFASRSSTSSTSSNSVDRSRGPRVLMLFDVCHSFIATCLLSCSLDILNSCH